MQCVAYAALEITANHSIVVFDVPDRRLNGLAAFELLLLTFAHRLDATPMNDFNTRIVGIHATVAQIHEGLFDFTARRLDQVIALADLRGQCVPVIRIANEAFGAHYQTLFVCDG